MIAVRNGVKVILPNVFTCRTSAALPNPSGTYGKRGMRSQTVLIAVIAATTNSGRIKLSDDDQPCITPTAMPSVPVHKNGLAQSCSSTEN